MFPITDEQKVRRANRAAWKKAHADKVSRECEARATAVEYRRTQRDAERPTEGTKHCLGCLQTLPLDAFLIHKTRGRLPRCRPCQNVYARASYNRKHGKTGIGTARGTRGTVSPERRREAAERIAHLTALLEGTAPGERITSEQGWDVATSELQKLWLLSGDKECLSCKAVIPPTAMLPPGPANFYPGKCRNCARTEYREHQLRVFGRITEGPPTILLRDGTSITVAEMARRHRQHHLHRS